MSAISWFAFDNETKYDLDTLGKTKDECWKAMRAGRGGLSVSIGWSSETREYEVYDEHTLDELVLEIERAPVVASYSANSYDIPMIEGLIGRKLRIRCLLDPLELIKKALGGPTRNTRLKQIAGWTLGMEKAGEGADAAELWATGQIAKLVRYTRRDVEVLRALVEHIREHGSVVGPNGLIHLDPPDWIKRLE